MATCRSCGADIVWKDVKGRGRVAFDSHETQSGEHRYGEVDGELVPVDPTRDQLAYQEHMHTEVQR